MALNEKQERFCQEFFLDFDVIKAAERVGYSEKYAKKNCFLFLQDERIIERLNSIREENFGCNSKCCKNKVVKEMWNMYEKAVEEKPVIEWNKDLKEYVETGEYQHDEKTALKCLELIAKICGGISDSAKKQEKGEDEGVEIFVRVEGEDEI